MNLILFFSICGLAVDVLVSTRIVYSGSLTLEISYELNDSAKKPFLNLETAVFDSLGITRLVTLLSRVLNSE